MRCSTWSSRSISTAAFPQATEGDLSRLRARVVSGEPLAEVAAVARAGRGAAARLRGAQDAAASAASRSSPMRSRRSAARCYLDGGLAAAERRDRAAVRAADRGASGPGRRSRMPRRACRSICSPAGSRCRATRSSGSRARPTRRPSTWAARSRRCGLRPRAAARAAGAPSRRPPSACWRQIGQ